MNGSTRGISEKLRSLLKEQLQGGGEETLQESYELGRRALAGGVGILGMASLHQELVRKILRDAGAPEESLKALLAAQVLFLEIFSAYEMTHHTVQDATATWRQLNNRLEAEAKRIAHALHDEAGQLLVMAHIALAELAEQLPPGSRRRLDETRRILDQIEEQLRQLSHELRPTILDDLGLVPALEFLADGMSRRSGLSVRVENQIQGRLPPELETALYRVCQEALANVSRHARASHAAIHLRREGGHIACRVRDDGVGFAIAPRELGSRRGLGLLGIEERLAAFGGTLSVKSSPGNGTELSVRIPLEESNVTSHSAC